MRPSSAQSHGSKIAGKRSINNVLHMSVGNFYTRLKRKKNDQIAIVATARKMLVSMLYMLKRNEPFDPPEATA